MIVGWGEGLLAYTLTQYLRRRADWISWPCATVLGFTTSNILVSYVYKLARVRVRVQEDVDVDVDDVRRKNPSEIVDRFPSDYITHPTLVELHNDVLPSYLMKFLSSIDTSSRKNICSDIASKIIEKDISDKMAPEDALHILGLLYSMQSLR